MEEHKLNTSHGTVHVVETGTGSPAVLLIHGNSFSSVLFKHILADKDLASSHRLIAFDLPGHGQSTDAADPERTYNISACAEVARELLQQLKVTSVIIVGNSFGGHIGIELVADGIEGIEIQGLMLSGTSPSSGLQQIVESFNIDPDNNIASKEVLTDEEIDMAIKLFCGTGKTPELEQVTKRADGRARRLMNQALLEGKGVDQRKAVAETKIPVAIVNGADDVFLKLDVFDRLEYGNLWKGNCIRLEGLYHAPFWQKPEAFLPVLKDFVTDCST